MPVPLNWPESNQIDEAWAWNFKRVLEQACQDSPTKLEHYVSRSVFEGLIKAAATATAADGMLVEVRAFALRTRTDRLKWLQKPLQVREGRPGLRAGRPTAPAHYSYEKRTTRSAQPAPLAARESSHWPFSLRVVADQASRGRESQRGRRHTRAGETWRVGLRRARHRPPLCVLRTVRGLVRCFVEK